MSHGHILPVLCALMHRRLPESSTNISSAGLHSAVTFTVFMVRWPFQRGGGEKKKTPLNVKHDKLVYPQMC